MKKRQLHFLLKLLPETTHPMLRTILLGLLLSTSILTFAQNLQTHKLSNKLLHYLSENETDDYPVTILLADRVDVETLAQQLSRASKAEKVQQLITTLKTKAQSTQGPVLELLYQSEGVDLASIQPLWITNMVTAIVSRQVIARLSELETVEWLDYLDSPEAIKAEKVDGTTTLVEDGIEPGLAAINAPALWAMGYTGHGTKALILDTGTDVRHPALDHNYWGLYVPKEQAWTGYADEPEDCQIHGTHVAGTVLGLDRAKNDTIGVAFNASWMAAPGIGCGPGNITNVNSFQSFQWALDPDGNPATTDDMPDVINNSWGWPYPDDSQCTSNWVDMLNAMELAGVAVIFAAGNEGPDSLTLRSPQSINTNPVNCFTVGAVLGYVPGFPIAEFSSRGPSLCGGTGALLIKPEVVAPGAAVRSSVPGGYNQLQGTSMASPHVAGAALLLKEAYPDATGKEIMEALYYSAIDLGEPGEDNIYGRGIIDVLEAFHYLADEGHIAVSPTVDRDAMLLDIAMSSISCTQETQFLEVSFENGGSEVLTNLEIRYSFNDPAQTNGSYNWSGSLEPSEREYLSIPVVNMPVGKFELVVELAQPNAVADERPFNNRLRSRILFIDESALDVAASTLGGQELCVGSNVLLEADYSGPGKIQWYSQATGGVALGEGNVFVSPSIDSDTTFYLDALFNRQIGPMDNTSGELVLATNGQEGKGVRFDCITPFTIKSVKVYAEEGGARIIKLIDENAVYGQKIVTIPGPGEHRIPLNFRVPPADDLMLVLDFGKPLYHSLGPDNFPFAINGLIALKPNTGGPADAYYYFYDWEIEHQHLCGRTAVPLMVNNTLDAPEAGFSASADSVHLEVDASVSFIDTSKNAQSWQWDFGDGTGSSDRNPVHTFQEAGLFPVSLKINNTEGCTDVAMQMIEVTSDESVAASEPMAVTSEFIIFPNPARQQFTIQFELSRTAEVAINLVDLTGRPIASKQHLVNGSGQISWDASSYPAGIYFVQFKIEDRLEIRKLVLVD